MAAERFFRWVDHLSQRLGRGLDGVHWMFHPQLYQFVDDQGRPFELDFMGVATTTEQARRPPYGPQRPLVAFRFLLWVEETKQYVPIYR